LIGGLLNSERMLIEAVGFTVCGIYSFNPQANSEHAYAIANNSVAICVQASGRRKSSKLKQPYMNNTNRIIRSPWATRIHSLIGYN
jgi:hypothetical protein